MTNKEFIELSKKMEDFLKIIDWLYSVNAQFGVDHVVVEGKIYWLDTNKDRQELYGLWHG